MSTNKQSVEENKAKNESKNNNWRFGVVGNIVKRHAGPAMENFIACAKAMYLFGMTYEMNQLGMM